MAEASFPGGIHPPQRKSLSTRTPLVQAPLPRRVVLALTQHLGAPAEPIVSIGQRVRTGEVIARAQGMISANVHASITGIVSAIEEHPVPHPSAAVGECRALCIVIDGESGNANEGVGELKQNDEGVGELKQNDEGVGELKHIDDCLRMSPLDWRSSDDATLIERLRDSGVVGLGGAGFPSAVKAQVRQRHAIDTLIVNAAECEPYITVDDMALRTHAAEIIEGARLFARLSGAERVIIGIEDNKPEAIDALRLALKKGTQEGNADAVTFTLRVIATRYPSGGEKQLVQLLTDREVPSRGLPADVGVLCHNPGTLLAALRAVRDGEPLISRIVTLTGEALDRPGNVEARIGTPMSELLAFAGLQTKRLATLIMGGPMMGITLDSTALPLIKTSNCLIAATTQELPPAPPEQPCIRCGACETACPASLLPQQLYWFSKSREHDKAELFNLFDCIECGACAYVCPSHIPLVSYYRTSKNEIRSREQEARRAEHARHRFEFRQARLAREEAEKQTKRQARAQRLTASQPPASTASAHGDLQGQIKKLRIAQAAAKAAVKKAEKTLARVSEANQGGAADLGDLETQLATAQENLQAIDTRLVQAQDEAANKTRDETQAPPQ